MTIHIQRGRQFLAADTSHPLFDRRGRMGSYLSEVAKRLVAQGHTVSLRQGTKTVKLSSPESWERFLREHAATRPQSEQFAKKFGITFGDFCNVLDDLAVAEAQKLSVNLSPKSALSKALSLDAVEGDYARKLSAESTLRLTGADQAKVEAKLVADPVIGKDVLSDQPRHDWSRDRTEQEAWADFKVGNGANGVFRRVNAAEVLYPLFRPNWENPEHMALVERFTMPMHIEVSSTNPDGTPKFKDRDEMFRETYFDDANGALEKAGASVRARVRFDDEAPYPVRRVLIQGKKGRAVDDRGNSAVHKFEKRFEGNFVDELKAQVMLRTGKEDAELPLKVSQLLYAHAQESGTLSSDGTLRLEPKHLVLQKRRRTHLFFHKLSEVTRWRQELEAQRAKLTAAGQAVPEALTRYVQKLDQQIAFMTEASTLLSKHRQGGLQTGFDAFIISADRYSVYDPAARAALPNDIDDEVGRIGRGLHLEAEWDAACSDGFEKAIKSIQAQLEATPAPANEAELRADQARLKEMAQLILDDVFRVVALLKEQMVAAGLEPDDRHASKEERANEFIQSKDRVLMWL